ncbi:MAG: radical SAM protein [Phycisphaerae bacterium]|jgi:predicted DNA-binding helix-hairpin-helix protein
MLVVSKPDTFEKLQLLSRDSQYDLACACGSNKFDRRTRGSNGKWIYPVTLPNGGRSLLFKTLLSNVCSSDCKYCPLHKNADIPRCTLNSDELVKTFLDYYNNGEVFGLFLSSGIIGTAEATMDKLITCAEILRKKHQFKGYIHLKILPGASPAAIEKAISVSNAVSLNIETPGKEFLEKLSSKKDFLRDIVEPMKLISRLTSQSRRRVKQTTQFIVGAAGESDQHIVNYTAALYERIGINRVYFSAYQRNNAENENNTDPQEGFTREHRLYQVDFLFRKYGFTQSDIIYDNSGLLSVETDPKEVWAKNHPEFFPIKVNTATRYNLLRVPGLGPMAVERILERRKVAKISSIDDIDNVNKRLLKAAKYLDFGGVSQNKAFLFNF